jgi:D-glucosaminate-6-phosphate ammonia-lyase
MTPLDAPRVICAAGFVTRLGGSPLSPYVRAAMDEALQSTWRIDDLQRAAGARIAAATGAEAGFVTAGAAAGLTLAAAACIAGDDLALIDRLPHPGRAPREIVVQRGHRNAYDHALRAAGARLVEVGFPYNEGVGATYEWQLEAAFGERTVAVAHLACADHLGVPLERVCALAGERGIPVIVDAAAELPPRENLRRFVEAGASAVCFSGGKGLGGPQGSGVLAATRAIVASVRLQTLDMDVDPGDFEAREGTPPPQHGVGRGLKVGPEQIAGLAEALRLFGERDLEAEAAEMAAWLGELPGRVDRERDFWPRLVIGAGDAARRLAAVLAAGSPAIVVPHGRVAAGEIVICPEAIRLHEREHVGRALRALG